MLIENTTLDLVYLEDVIFQDMDPVMGGDVPT